MIDLLTIGRIVLGGHQAYELWRTGQSFLFGDPLKRELETKYNKQQQQFAAQQEQLESQQLQIQKINDKLLYAANLESLHWQQPQPNLPDITSEITPDKLTQLAAPVQTLTTAFNQGKPQTLLGSSLIALPPHFNTNEVIDGTFIDYFIEDEYWPPAQLDQIWVLYLNAANKYHIGLLPRQCLTQQGLDVYQEWQPNQRVLPPELRCQENMIRSIIGLELPKPKLESIHGWDTKRVQKLQQDTAAYLQSPVELQHYLKDGGKGPIMCIIPAGKFLMGSPDTEKERESDETQHKVTISKPFFLGKYAVTFAEYDAFCAATGREKPKDENWGRDKRPVINVSWEDAVAYCQWLSEQTGKEYRLPTEAEWEYACRAGTNTPFHTGNCISTDQANYNGNYPYSGCPKGEYRNKTVPVDSFEPNPWGLYQMHGNVYEWCSDWYAKNYYQQSPDIDPTGTKDASAHVLRGGSWGYNAGYVRAANRLRFEPGDRYDSVGFRACEVQVK